MENTTIKQPYQKPEIQVIDIKIESPLLVASDSKPSMGKNIPLN
ncbi:MAG: hypothetical protein PUC50_11770 [Bacteroidales bacterium]|nr:hypothetical protein [Bacteroidales bacterium]